MTRLWFACLLLAAPAWAAPTVTAVPVARDGDSVLYAFGERRVLVTRGTPRARGLAHGRLLRKRIAENVRAFLDEWAIRRKGRTRAELMAIWKKTAPHIPAHFHEELKGLAEGSGVPLKDLQLLHAIPSRYHCTGTAALPAVTKDGRLYHTRSLDYPLDIGRTVRPQTNALLLVSVPRDGIAHACVGWAGFLGCVTGMNIAGVSIGEMGSRSSDESFDGLPMIFMVREALRTAHNLEEAKAVWRKHPRTCGYNFILCDEKNACAVECNRSRLVFFAPGDKKENAAPHYAIPNVVRRCNHFIDRELAKTQRRLYDPRMGASAPSFGVYLSQGRALEAARGTIGLDTMISILRAYPPFVSCLHQAVMIPADRVLWVSQATDPAHDPLPGAQSQPFLRYDLRALVKGPPRGAELWLRGGGPLRRLRTVGDVTIDHLRLMSSGPPPTDVLHAEYFRPKTRPAGPMRGVVVLHILDGRFYTARMIAMTLARHGTAALFVQLPYYGYRRPAGGVDMRKVDLPDLAQAIRQGVGDVVKAAKWLRERPEVDKERVGIVGVSLGSFVAQVAAGIDKRFDRCVFVLGGGSMTEAIYSGSKDTIRIERRIAARGYTKEQVRKALMGFEPMDRTEGLKGVLMINCNQDEVVPPESTRRYWEAIGRPEIVWYDGGHYAAIRRLPEIVKRILDHFGRE